MAVKARLNEKRDRIIIEWPFSGENVSKTKSIPGRRFVPADKGGPYWTLPLDMITARRVRGLWDEIEWDPNLLAWGREQRKRDDGLKALAHATDLPVERLSLAVQRPGFAQWLRPYQRADVAFLAATSAINANEQGLGKTPETIAAIIEAGLENGPNLVIPPVTSIEVVWQTELERWSTIPVLASEDPAERKRLVREAARMAERGEPFWLVVNADMIRIKQIKAWDQYKQKEVEVSFEYKFPELFEIQWNSITIDEFHKMGLNNEKSLLARGLYKLRCKPEARRYALSGTPMGGKALKLYGAFKFIAPDAFSAKWNWIENWFEVSPGYANSKVVGGLLPGVEDEFYAQHSKYMVRHLKSEVLPQLPPKQYVDVWCKMTPKQRKQYEKFAKDAEVTIDEQQLGATGILAEYARLKFFSTAYCDLEITQKRCQCGGDQHCPRCAGEGTYEVKKLKPTFDSGKLPYLMDKLAESGIDPDDPSGEAVAVIGSQSVEVCEMVHRYLNEQGIPTELLTGKTVKPGERARLVRGFQNGDYRVLVVSTLAGGVSITLDRADTVHILDETWVPDDQEQLEDRVHRASRIHQVTVFYYRMKDTIEQYIKEVNDEKAFTNESILDTRRNGFRAVKGAK